MQEPLLRASLPQLQHFLSLVWSINKRHNDIHLPKLICQNQRDVYLVIVLVAQLRQPTAPQQANWIESYFQRLRGQCMKAMFVVLLETETLKFTWSLIKDEWIDDKYLDPPLAELWADATLERGRNHLITVVSHLHSVPSWSAKGFTGCYTLQD